MSELMAGHCASRAASDGNRVSSSCRVSPVLTRYGLTADLFSSTAASICLISAWYPSSRAVVMKGRNSESMTAPFGVLANMLKANGAITSPAPITAATTIGQRLRRAGPGDATAGPGAVDTSVLASSDVARSVAGVDSCIEVMRHRIIQSGWIESSFSAGERSPRWGRNWTGVDDGPGVLPQLGHHGARRPHACVAPVLEPVRPDQGAAPADGRDDQGAPGRRADQPCRLRPPGQRRPRADHHDPGRTADARRPRPAAHQGLE